MGNLLSETPNACVWAETTIASLKDRTEFGSFKSGVIWAELPDAASAVPIVPEKVIERINIDGQALLLGHDPGKPLGQVLTTRLFQTPDGRKFIAAILGLYGQFAQLSFSHFGVDLLITPSPPEILPALNEGNWIEIAVDPRDVENAWVDLSVEGAPIRVKRIALSNNAAEAATDLIRLTLPYVALVWNPFVTVVAKEAGKDVYKVFRGWLERFIKRVSERKKPLLVIQSSLHDCDISFILRGNDVDTLLAARERLETAALQAEGLVKILIEKNAPARTLFYEFDGDRQIWLPSYAILRDGRLVSDNRALLVVENLPQGLSLGLADGIDENNC